ncbi:four helix bundle protein, partial [Bacteroides timonensis]|uniref:four helix bundle protein n=1 Tax=Bacteroides timonensis TaxID=1470345 RepID=UPI0005C76BBF
MALSEDLPLYRDTYRLLNLLIPLTQGFPRFFRYGLGSRMVELNLDMLSLIYKANSSYEKVTVITEPPVPADVLHPPDMSIRVCNPIKEEELSKVLWDISKKEMELATI